jgi:hypothetical protein
MAELVLGMGTSHSLIKDPSYWLHRGDSAERFLRGRGLDLQQVPTRPELKSRLTLEQSTEDFERCNAAVKALGDVLEDANVDTLLVVTNLHGTPRDDFQVIFGIYTGDSLPVSQLPNGDEAAGREPGAPLPEWATHPQPADPALARYVLDALIEDGFDVACMDHYKDGTGIGHEHTVLYEDYIRKETALVPFQLSRYLPNQATSARCYALGQALRRAIDSWESDKRVAIVASGGLSHQIVDEELDQDVISALLEKDRDLLCSLPRDRLNVLPGTAETLNWVTVAGATEDKQMTLLGYVPSYWSMYGTGHGFTFAYWR